MNEIVRRWCGMLSSRIYPFSGRTRAVAVLVVGVTLASMAHAQGPEPAGPLDEQLFAPSQSEPAGGDAQPSDASDFKEQLRRELGAAAISEESQPVVEIIQLMRQAETRLADQDAGVSTQRVQAQIVADLGRLIEQARGQAGSAGSQQSGSSQVGTKPEPGEGRGGAAPSGTASTGSQQSPHGEPPDPARIRQWMQRLWGELPDRQREQMLQSPPEEFLPAYERLIETYFRRLATEREARVEEWGME